MRRFATTGLLAAAVLFGAGVGVLVAKLPPAVDNAGIGWLSYTILPAAVNLKPAEIPASLVLLGNGRVVLTGIDTYHFENTAGLETELTKIFAVAGSAEAATWKDSYPSANGFVLRLQIAVGGQVRELMIGDAGHNAQVPRALREIVGALGRLQTRIALTAPGSVLGSDVPLFVRARQLESGVDPGLVYPLPSGFDVRATSKQPLRVTHGEAGVASAWPLWQFLVFPGNTLVTLTPADGVHWVVSWIVDWSALAH